MKKQKFSREFKLEAVQAGAGTGRLRCLGSSGFGQQGKRVQPLGLGS